MSRININKVTIGHSSLTNTIYVGVLNKAGNMWLEKKDVTNSFIDCVIRRWVGETEVITAGDEQWEITVKKIK